MGLSINYLYSCLWILKYLVHFSSLDPIFFLGNLWSFDFTSFSSVLSHFAHFHLIQMQFILRLDIHSHGFIYLWFLSVYFKDLNFFLYFSNSLLSANCSMFTVSVLPKYIGFSSFNKHGSFFLFTGSIFFHLSHLVYTFMCCIVHSTLISFNTIRLHLYIFNKSDLFQYIHIFLQYSVHGIISYRIIS